MKLHSWILALVLVVGAPLGAQPAENFKMARQAYRAGDYPKALTLLDQLVSADDKDTKTLLLRAATRFRAQNLDGALEDYNRVLKLQPDSTAALGGRGVVYGEKDELNPAEEDFNSILKLDPKNAPAFYQRASIRQRKGDADNAIEDLTAAIGIAPSNIYYKERALLYFFKNKYSLALGDWKKASELDPKSSEALAGQAIAHFRIDQAAEAGAALKEARKLEPRWSDITWVQDSKNQGPNWNRKASEALKELLGRQ